MNRIGGEGRPGGVQSVRRAACVLRVLAAHRGPGMGLSALASAVGLHKVTVYRLLQTLVGEGFVEQARDTRRYRAGPELVLLGLAAASGPGIRELARPSLLRLAAQTGETAFLSVRSGNDAVCIDRQEGAFPIETLVLEVGSRRPLGLGAGGLAILAALPDAEVHEVIARNAARVATYPSLDARTLLQMVEATRRRGYSLFNGRAVVGLTAVGVAVLDHRGDAVAALSMAATAERMSDDRRRDVVSLLAAEAAALERCMPRPGPAAPAGAATAGR